MMILVVGSVALVGSISAVVLVQVLFMCARLLFSFKTATTYTKENNI